VVYFARLRFDQCIIVLVLLLMRYLSFPVISFTNPFSPLLPPSLPHSLPP